MESWSVSSLPGRAKAVAWSDFYSQRIEKVSIAPANHDEFDSEIRIGEFGPIRIMQMSCGRCSIHRGPHHIARASGRVYTLIFQVRGAGTFTHYGHEAALTSGDFTLCHGEAPYAYQLGDDCEVVMLRVPANVLKEHLPSPDYFCGRHLSGEGLTQTAGTLITTLCAQLSAALSSDFQHRVARHLLDMVATSYAIAFESEIKASSNVSAWHARAKLYIEQHLREPDLSPCSIAEKLKLSPRYLRTIFASGNEETVSAYILRRRLEECARQIEDPRWNGHSITAIAFSWGFNSAPHFTRSFRDRYGVSPRRYRLLRVNDSGAGGTSVKNPDSSGPSAPASLLPPTGSPLPGRAQSEWRESS